MLLTAGVRDHDRGATSRIGDTVTENGTNDYSTVFQGSNNVITSNGANDQIGLQGDYSGGLALGPNSMTGIEQLVSALQKRGAMPASGFPVDAWIDSHNLIRQINERGITVFLVEQNAYHALKLAHRGYVMVNGLITLSGTGSELLDRPVSPIEFWQYPTLNALARFLTGSEPKSNETVLDHDRHSMDEPIAVIGLGCRFPDDIHGPEAFWQFLCEGRSAVGEVPPDRWPRP